jgi:hypothetical protein
VVEDAAEDAAFGDEGEQVLGGANGTADAGEASLEDAAVEVPLDRPVEEADGTGALLIMFSEDRRARSRTPLECLS